MIPSDSTSVRIVPAPACPPAQLGWRMPAEWEPHEATWISWPRKECISFPGARQSVMPVLAQVVDALFGSERVHINVSGPDQEQEVRDVLRKHKSRVQHVRFFHIPTNEPWCRDHGPMFLTRPGAPKPAVVDWEYNAWGWKYPPFDLDNAVPGEIARRLGLEVFTPGAVLEGGSVDVNGTGSLLTTKSCLLNPNRNPDLNCREIEQKLHDFLAVTNVLWLGDGVEGNDSDGHVNGVARFIGRNKVVACVEDDPDDTNYLALQENLAKLRAMDDETGTPLEVHPLPMPGRIVREGRHLPASYANFYIANKVILLPVFGDNADAWATAVMQHAFPARAVVAIDCRELIWGLGALHCLTQQQPCAV